MVIGALVGAVAGLAAIVLFAFGFRRMRPGLSRAASYAVSSVALVALLLTLPAWIVVLSGKDTRGEPFDYHDLDAMLVLLLVAPPLTLAALVTRLARRKRPS